MSKSKVMNDRRRVQVSFEDSPSLVHPEFKSQCDIRNIMNQYKRQGIRLPTPQFSSEINDLTNLPDYQESLNTVIRAQEALDSLPAQLRKRFANDPSQFIDYVNDPSNRDEMIKLGMIEAPVVPVIDQKTSPEGKSDPSPT